MLCDRHMYLTHFSPSLHWKKNVYNIESLCFVKSTIIKMYCVINCIAKVKPKFTSENIATSRKNQSNEHEWTILPATKK